MMLSHSILEHHYPDDDEDNSDDDEDEFDYENCFLKIAKELNLYFWLLFYST